jgi:hypothetical protein
MIAETELFVVVKLVSGENVLAVLLEEDEDYIMLENPMCIRTTPDFDMGREHVTAHPLCQFSDDKDYIISKKHMLFCKKMHHVFIPHYMRIVEDSQRMTMLTDEQEENTTESVFFEGNDTIN